MFWNDFHFLFGNKEHRNNHFVSQMNGKAGDQTISKDDDSVTELFLLPMPLTDFPQYMGCAFWIETAF